MHFGNLIILCPGLGVLLLSVIKIANCFQQWLSNTLWSCNTRWFFYCCCIPPVPEK